MGRVRQTFTVEDLLQARRAVEAAELNRTLRMRSEPRYRAELIAAKARLETIEKALGGERLGGRTRKRATFQEA